MKQETEVNAEFKSLKVEAADNDMVDIILKVRIPGDQADAFIKSIIGNVKNPLETKATNQVKAPKEPAAKKTAESKPEKAKEVEKPKDRMISPAEAAGDVAAAAGDWETAVEEYIKAQMSDPKSQVIGKKLYDARTEKQRLLISDDDKRPGKIPPNRNAEKPQATKQSAAAEPEDEDEFAGEDPTNDEDVDNF